MIEFLVYLHDWAGIPDNPLNGLYLAAGALTGWLLMSVLGRSSDG